jgi:hypothetical protein
MDHSESPKPKTPTIEKKKIERLPNPNIKEKKSKKKKAEPKPKVKKEKVTKKKIVIEPKTKIEIIPPEILPPKTKIEIIQPEIIPSQIIDPEIIRQSQRVRPPKDFTYNWDTDAKRIAYEKQKAAEAKRDLNEPFA